MTTILENKINGTGYKLSMNYAMVYDTAWTMALGLNNSLNYLNDSGLQQYTNNPYYLNGILKGIQDVNFAGVSVSVFMLQLTFNFDPPLMPSFIRPEFFY